MEGGRDINAPKAHIPSPPSSPKNLYRLFGRENKKKEIVIVNKNRAGTVVANYHRYEDRLVEAIDRRAATSPKPRSKNCWRRS